MLPTFTGNSRRPRNVNLSGQSNTNPWGSSGWSANSGGASGTSKTVANAQAEREKRQKDREELAAAKSLQRIWRGHQDRQKTRKSYRITYDEDIQQTSSQEPRHRVARTMPLLLALFDFRREDDQARLDIFARDISAYQAEDPALGMLNGHSLDRLACLIVVALERRPFTTARELLQILSGLVRRRPESVSPVLSRYYKVLAHCFSSCSDPSEQAMLCDVVGAPLSSGTASSLEPAYQAIAFQLLTFEDLPVVRHNPGLLTTIINHELLSKVISKTILSGLVTETTSRDGQLWLLAHFIALSRTSAASQDATYLKALFLQLSNLAVDIRVRYNLDEDPDAEQASDDEDLKMADPTLGALPVFVASQLEFLVNDEGISELLRRFTTTSSSTAGLSEDANLLAGYTLVLLKCFPQHGDDIKMRLFHGDITTSGSQGQQSIPTVKYFWLAASKTEIFRKLMQSKIAHPASILAPLLQPHTKHDEEWRTLSLFLELYNFLLRVTDDEDFLPTTLQTMSQQSPATARIRSSGLGLEELKSLTSFLKNLTFPLYHDLPTIISSTKEPARLDHFMGAQSKPSARTANAQDSVAIAFGNDIIGLRQVATTTMRSLYERDSRRKFLPQDFWLMTSKFDMNGFTSAVVLEEQQKNETAEEDEDDEDEIDRSSFHTATVSRISRAAQIERQRQLRRIQREKLLAQAAPKLEILRNMPFIIPFEIRVQIFRQFIYLDKNRRRGGHVDPDRWRLSVIQSAGGFGGPTPGGREILGRHTARVKRGSVFDDAYDQFYNLGESIKEPIQITFVDQFDQPEAGIDGGGVTKEFLTSAAEDAFDPSETGPGYFIANQQNLLYPNPSAFDERAELLRYTGTVKGSPEWNTGMADLSRRYEFLGRLIGKCMYEGILVDISFASFFLLKWASSGHTSPTDHRANLNDLREMDPELYQGLISLKNYPGDVSDLSLDFTITDQVKDFQGKVHTFTRPLRKEGSSLAVTNKDRPLYISYVVNHRLVAQPYRQTKAFLRGLGTIINPYWLSMFNQSELQRLVGGDSTEIDVEDLRANTQYSGLYAIGDDGLEHPTIEMFWQVMHGFRDSERREVLKYVTSTPRAPLLGFAQLSPAFSIRDGGTDESRLPSTSTCVNLLKLPRYSSAEKLRSKLLYAIQSGAGFDLS
ncbi:ubiquitin-protein ligase E3 C [Microdochium nivale]|nr:ubiquitin-protein ligase E3 C [Microdochium nivale]